MLGLQRGGVPVAQETRGCGRWGHALMVSVEEGSHVAPSACLAAVKEIIEANSSSSAQEASKCQI